MVHIELKPELLLDCLTGVKTGVTEEHIIPKDFNQKMPFRRL